MTHFRAGQSLPRHIGPSDTRECRYCAKPVRAIDSSDDGRGDWYLPNAHFFECWHSGREGLRYRVVSSTCDSQMGFPYALRAIDEAEAFAQYNPGRTFAVIDTDTRDLIGLFQKVKA
jgi:hypothetical protein